MRDPIDAFVLARLEREGVGPTNLASRSEWLRRVNLDLIGLPPSVSALERFLSDSVSGAEERVVDELLHRPEFAERWARHWMDLVRYSETRGFEYDFRLPNAYQYRDYLIRAIDADVPLDDLVVEHIAGDLLPTPRPGPQPGSNDSIVGTAFWYFGEAAHSPVDTRRDETDRVAGQIDVFSKAFLGLTVACARCHDHKFDAISAEDYYALCGYLQSSTYRQVRFETMQHNGEVLRRLEQWDSTSASTLRAKVQAQLRAAVADTDQYLVAARTVLTQGPVQQGVLEWPGVDYILEDFERAEYSNWRVQGTAFGTGPVSRDEIPEYQGEVGGRGDRVVNGHHARYGETVQSADAHVGWLTSEPFLIDRKYLHFYVGGGTHEGTSVQVWVGDALVRRQSGFNSNVMRPVHLDLSPWIGQRAQIRLVDEATGGWGHIAADHFVCSDAPEPSALEIDQSRWQRAAWDTRIAKVAKFSGLKPERLRAWVQRLQHAAPATPAPDIEELPAHQLVFDSANLASAHWLCNGPTFGTGPRPAGTLLVRDQSGQAGLRLLAGAAAVADPVWNVLRTSAANETDPSQISWEQAGRTLRTPSFRLEHGHLGYWVRGAGAAFVVMDSHRMVQSPLYGDVFHTWGDAEYYRWVEHDLSDYVGRRVHVEFSPSEQVGAIPLEIGRVIDAAGPLPPSPSEDWFEQRLPRRFPEVPLSWDTEFAGQLRQAIARWSSDADLDANAWSALDWMLSRPQLFVGATWFQHDPELQTILGKRRELCGQILAESATAPAIWDGPGENEWILFRGNSKTPGPKVPRRFLSQANATATNDSAGSGRLRLAEALVDPQQPFLPRVLVNRVWHHLFERGIVPTVDDFGVLGERPTHPELLDYLAREFIAMDWSLRQLIRRLVLSNTYRQSSVAPAWAAAKDPGNRLFHSMSVRRLQAEAIRDSILFLAGSYNPTRFGPSIPIALNPFLEGRGKPNVSGPIDGEGRRSLYLSVRRNFPDPLLQTFDFPPQASTVGRRSTSNVPAQSLALMNSPFVHQQAQQWAERLLDEWPNDAQRVENLYLSAYARRPEPGETRRALEFLEEHDFDGEREQEVELAAWTDLCHVVINTKEFLFVR